MAREFRFLVECCQFSFAPGNEATIRELGRQLDWPLLVRLARFHRVQGLLANTLAAIVGVVPEEAAAEIILDAQVIAARNLHSAVESQRLLMTFVGAGVPLLFIKGLTLGALAYGNPNLKSAIDIDVLVAPGNLGHAADLLAGLDWELILPKGDEKRLVAWHRTAKESVWWHPRTKIQADLHTGLSDNHRLIQNIGTGSPQQWVGVGQGIELPTLAGDELFAYLCVHGASSCWFRLKWITDLAALIHSLPVSEIERLYRRSQELGASRAAAQALLVAGDLYGVLRETELRAELERSRPNRWLAAAALRQLAGRNEPREPTDRPWGTLTIHWAQFLLRPEPGYKISELLRQAEGLRNRLA